MDSQVILWIFGSVITVLGLVVGYVLGRVNKLDDRINDAFRQIAALDKYVAENYVRGHEISEVKRAIEALRTEVGQAVTAIRDEVQRQIGDMTKAIIQMNQHKS